jgi:ActR/RegA family two-component response regulator
MGGFFMARISSSSSTVVIAQSDPCFAEKLESDLQVHFGRVVGAQSVEEVLRILRRHEAHVAVLGLELASVDEVKQLARTFADVTIVCTHHFPEDRLWVAALSAGAAELCHPLDTSSILAASRSAMKQSSSTAA